MLNKLKARKSQLQAKGGFTLVELIVVLVILAILAALLIPALTGYIDKANEKKIVSETRMLVMAAQTAASDEYGAKSGTIIYDKSATTKATLGDQKVCNAEIKALVDFPVADDVDLKIDFKANSGEVTHLEWTSNSKTCTYNGTSYSIK